MNRDYVRLKQSLDSLRCLIRDVEMSGGLQCPIGACDNRGEFEVQIDDGVPHTENCQFCWETDDSIFNRIQQKAARKRDLQANG